MPWTDVTSRVQVRVVGGSAEFRDAEFWWAESDEGGSSLNGYNVRTASEADGWQDYTTTRGTGTSEYHGREWVNITFQIMSLDPGAEVHVRNPGIASAGFVDAPTDPDLDLDWLDGGTVAGLIGPAPVGWTANDGGALYYSQSRDSLALRITGSTGWATMTGTPQGPSTSEPATYLTDIVDSTAEASLNIGAQGTGTTSSDEFSVPAGGGTMRWVREQGVNTGANFRPIRFTNADAAQAAIGETFYFRALLTEGEYSGPWFDGDTPRGAADDGSLVTYTWEADGTSTATATSIEVTHNQVWRAIDDGPWLLIEDDMDLNGAISDPLPAIGDHRRNLYRVTAISALGSAMHSELYELIVPTHGPGGSHGWVYLNGGPSMGDVVKVRANATRSGTQGLAKAQRYYSGNGKPEERSGTALAREWTLEVHSREDLYEAGESRPEDIEALQVTGGVICYRDTKGARWFASMGPVGDSYRSILGDLSWPMVEVGYREGLASEARETGDDDQ